MRAGVHLDARRQQSAWQRALSPPSGQAAALAAGNCSHCPLHKNNGWWHPRVPNVLLGRSVRGLRWGTWGDAPLPAAVSIESLDREKPVTPDQCISNEI